jgi:hypothetical protein
MPSWQVVESFVTACGVPAEEVPQWKQRWEDTRSGLPRKPVQIPEEPQPQGPPPTRPRPPGRAGPQSRRIALYRPDPAKIQTLNDYTNALRRLKISAGDPTFRDLARGARPEYGQPTSTLADLFKRGRRRLAWPVVESFLLACGVSDQDFRLWMELLVKVTYGGGWT